MKAFTYWDYFFEMGNDGVDMFSFILASESEDALVILELSIFGFYFLIGKSI